MTLRERILILLSLAFCGYWGLEYIVYTFVVEPNMERLAFSEAQQHIQKCEKELHGESDRLRELAERLSSGSQLMSLSGQVNFPADIADKADFLGVVDESGSWIQFQVAPGLSQEPDRDDFLNQLKKGKTPFVSNLPALFSQKGVVMSAKQPLLVGSSPVSTSQRLTPNGTLIVGRFITQEFLGKVQKRMRTRFICVPYSPQAEKQLPSSAAQNSNLAGSRYLYQPLGDELVRIYAVMKDRTQQPALILHADMSVHVLQETQRILYTAGFIRLVATVPAILLLTVVFQMAVVSPIVRLIKDIIAIGKGKYIHMPRSQKRRDEIGILAFEFDRMLEQLDAAKKKLVEKSFVSGMAEISSGILHNARNALSPLVSGLERMGERVSAMDSPELRKAIQELRQDTVDPQRKADLQRFVLLSLEAHQQYVQQARESVDGLSRQVCQIEEMLNGQRSFRGAARPLESIGLKQLIDEAFEMIPANLRSEIRIHVDKQIERLRPVHVQRVVFLQVLENLLINAAESLRKAGPLCPKINISAQVELIDNIEMLHLQIKDNGAGIEPEMMEKLFERGATTKPQGMAGIGLHWCANAISAMKGRIWAESKGANLGACLHIMMPVLQDKESLMVKEKGTNNESGYKTQNIAR